MKLYEERGTDVARDNSMQYFQHSFGSTDSMASFKAYQVSLSILYYLEDRQESMSYCMLRVHRIEGSLSPNSTNILVTRCGVTNGTEGQKVDEHSSEPFAKARKSRTQCSPLVFRRSDV